MKNICFFIGDITKSGGTERVTLQIAGALAKTGNYNISILSVIESDKEPFFDIPSNIKRQVVLSKPVSPISKAILRFPIVLSRIVYHIKENKVDILIDVDGILDVFSLPAKLFTKIKVITWEHFNYYAFVGSKFRKMLKKASAKFSDYIIVLTNADKGYYEQNLKMKCPLEFIYNPADMPDNTTYNADSKTILSVGRLNPQKGFDILIDVARIVFEKQKDWKWLIAGEGEDRSLLNQKIKQYGLENHVILLGNIKNIDEYYRQSGLYVLTSRFEGFGLVLVEAKKHKVPIVSFDCQAGPSELILTERNGFLIECFDVKAMADKINLLIENRELRIAFSERTHEDTEKYKYSVVIDKWEKVFNNILK